MLDIESAQRIAASVPGKPWLAGARVEEEADEYGEAQIRVWVEVPEDFDLEANFDDLDDLTRQIRDAFRQAGFTAWVMVSPETPSERAELAED